MLNCSTFTFLPLRLKEFYSPLHVHVNNIPSERTPILLNKLIKITNIHPGSLYIEETKLFHSLLGFIRFYVLFLPEEETIAKRERQFKMRTVQRQTEKQPNSRCISCTLLLVKTSVENILLDRCLVYADKREFSTTDGNKICLKFSVNGQQ